MWLVVGIASIILSVLACGGGLLILALVLAGGGALTAAETLPLAGVAALSLGFGVPLMLHGWAGWRARPSRPFDPSRIGWLWLLLALLVGLGTVVSTRSLAPALLLPPIHVLTMALPPLIVLWLVGRALRGLGGSWREVVASMAGGGSLGLGFSLVSEGLIVFVLILVAAIVAPMVPGGTERLTELATNLQDPTWLTDSNNLMQYLLSPVIALSALGLFSVLVPLIEEAFKTLAAGVVGRWVRPHSARAFLWGVAGGAGFALAENLFNGALGGAESWTVGAVARFGATMMHCATGGLVGWGWGQLWTTRRPLRLLGAYAAAVTIHGLWNAVSVGVVILGSSALLYEGRDDLRLVLAGLGTLTLVGLIGLMTVSFIVALVLAGQKLAADLA